MFEMNDEVIRTHQNLINYTNADSMFMALDSLLKENNREFVLRREHLTEEDCVKSYVLRSNAMRYACDAIEHYAKAILIQNGKTWDNAKSFGHNLLELFKNLDEESRSTIITAFLPINNIHDFFKNKGLEEELEIEYLKTLLKKYNLINNNEKLKDDIDKHHVPINQFNDDVNYNYKPVNLKDKPITIFPDENIKPLKKTQTVENELSKINPPSIPGQPREQLFSIKSRFPGQYLVDGNAEFLISLAYIFNQLSNNYRKRDNLTHFY